MSDTLKNPEIEVDDDIEASISRQRQAVETFSERHPEIKDPKMKDIHTKEDALQYALDKYKFLQETDVTVEARNAADDPRHDVLYDVKIGDTIIMTIFMSNGSGDECGYRTISQVRDIMNQKKKAS